MDVDVNELLLTALRASFVYFYLLIIVRILGKREIGASSAFDLLVALMLGDVVDEVIYGDVTILQGVIAIVVNASGCGVQVREYAHLLARDPAYAKKAERVSALAKDPAELLPALTAELQQALPAPAQGRVVFHPPCTLQHGLKIRGEIGQGRDVAQRIESVLVESHDAAVDIIGSEPEKWRPTSRETADHSLPYIVAAAA